MLPLPQFVIFVAAVTLIIGAVALAVWYYALNATGWGYAVGMVVLVWPGSMLSFHLLNVLERRYG